MRALVALAIATQGCAAGAAWSFRDFFEGSWDLERPRAGSAELDLAHYALTRDAGGDLTGTYHEDGDLGPENEMNVRVVFHDTAGLTGEFQLAKAGAMDDTFTEPKTVFEFAFRSQGDGRFHLSDSAWKSRKGGTVQFVAITDAFVFTRVSFVDCADEKAKADPARAQPAISSWTAARRGAPRPSAGGAAAGKPSLLKRWGKWVGVAFLYSLYRLVTHKAKQA
jgi:hypothetical protein